jgi:hypothetical protein
VVEVVEAEEVSALRPVWCAVNERRRKRRRKRQKQKPSQKPGAGTTVHLSPKPAQWLLRWWPTALTQA